MAKYDKADLERRMKGAVDSLKSDLSGLRTGRASSNLLDPVIARRYRDTVLAPGGSAPAATLVANFLGRPFRFEAYRLWLNQTGPN